MIVTGKDDGVKKLAGWATTAFRRLDRAQPDFHRGRSFDKNRSGRGHAELRGTLSISTATGQLSSSQPMIDTIEEEVGYAEFDGGGAMYKEITVGGRFGE